jgi:threonine/homoserine efflux transporter RhtA
VSRIDGEEPPVPAPLMLLGAIIGFQLGAALGAKVLPDLGTAGAAFARNAVATGLLVVVARPSLRALAGGRAKEVAAVALCLAAINLTFYAAVARIPLAVVVTISFVGPLTVAVIGSRSRRDVVGGGVLTAIPYTLEFLALRWMRAATYGVLVSLEPAVAAIVGVLLLGQTPTAVEVVAIALVVIASVGASRATA